MPQVTKISIQKRRKDLVNIFLDGKYSFSVNLEDIFFKKIKNGQDLSSSEVRKLKKSKVNKNILDLAISYASSRAHSQKEIVSYLKRKDQTETEIKKIVTKLKKLLLINDSDFAKWFVGVRQKSGKGSRLIKFELSQKGVNKDIISQVLDGADSDKNIVSVTIEKKLKMMRIDIGDQIDLKTKSKLLRFLVSKGFNYETSIRTIDLKLKKV